MERSQAATWAGGGGAARAGSSAGQSHLSDPGRRRSKMKGSATEPGNKPLLSPRESSSVNLVTARKAAQRGYGFRWVDLEAAPPREIADVAACFGLRRWQKWKARSGGSAAQLELYDECLFAVIKQSYIDSDEVVEVA